MGTGGKCFVATAAYGSDLAAEVIHLKTFRDERLLKTNSGKYFVKQYYKYGPFFAKYIRNRNWVRFIIRQLLRPIIFLIKKTK